MNDANFNPSAPAEEWRVALARLVESESEPGDDALVAGALREDTARVGELRAQLELDALLRQEAEPSAEAFVEAVAAQVRPSAEDEQFVRRVRQALTREGRGGPVHVWHWPLTLRWVAVLGFVVVLVAVLLLLLPQAGANAATVLQQALKAHSTLLDRCYRVEVRGERDGDSPPRQQSRLWTRGNRFWNEMQTDGKTVAWGRDEAGGVWFALSPKVGARLAVDEVPEQLQTACDLRSVQMETLLREILAGFELRRESVSADRYLIHAQPKPGTANRKYSAVLLEVDSRTHVVQRIELQRAYQARTVATVTFALIESGLQNDASYTLEGHLDADGMAYARATRRGERGQVIAEFLKLVRVRSGSGRTVLPP